ncbi:MAG: hypothetical protein GY759_21150 [Chloroflexi bacterium]|nr:hypothetical protein [Chloroflexota bacterium]
MNLVPTILSLAAGIASYAGVIHRGSSGGSVRQRPGGWGNRPLPPLPTPQNLLQSKALWLRHSPSLSRWRSNSISLS